MSAIADGSAHRVISDLSAFIGMDVEFPSTHHILAAGDLNTIYDAKDDYDKNWSTGREHTIWDRMKALGLDSWVPGIRTGDRPTQPLTS